MCNKLQHDSENIRLRHEVEHLKAALREQQRDNIQLYTLIYEIRKAAGDPEGRLMQDELIRHIEKLQVRASASASADDYNAWRITFQSGEAAAQAAFAMMMQARKECSELSEFREKAFIAHPNIDIDIEKISE